MSATARRSQLLQHLSSSAKSGGSVSIVGVGSKPQPTQDDQTQVQSVIQDQSAPVSQLEPIQSLSDEEQKLADFEAVLDEVEAEQQAAQVPQPTLLPPAPDQVQQDMTNLAAATPAAILASTPDPLNPPLTPAPAQKKEAQPEPVSLSEMATASQLDQQPTQEVSPQEHGAPGVQVVEQEPSPEISPEVSEYLEKVESHEELQPHEVVIANQNPQVLPPKMLPKPVIVLPISPDLEKEGESKSVMWSVRWLIEWSRKIMKMFSGKVIYKEAESKA